MKPKLVVFTGAGISAESGIRTFRDADGLWEEYPVMQVCSADGFRSNPALVHQFYNERRRQLISAQPNAAHYGLVALQHDFDVKVITQNVDNLHERAGLTDVTHLHGELMKARAVDNPDLLFPLTEDNYCTTPDTIIEGHHVRPHIVFFQEAVPMFEPATDIVREADIFVIIGTSLAVYPAASLINYVRRGVPVFYIDPKPAYTPEGMVVIPEKATTGVAKLTELLKNYI
jgi:NAD-dependent deacetylase